MTFTVDIPGVPPSANETLRMHFGRRHRLKLDWMKYMYLFDPHARSVLRDWADAKVKLAVEITLHHARMYDKDNSYGACKVIFDALRDTGLIFDDKPKYLDQTVWQQKCPNRKRHTTIEIRPAEEQQFHEWVRRRCDARSVG